MPEASRFLIDTPFTAPGEYVLGNQESYHAVNVLRHRPGDMVTVFDGKGNYAESVIVEANRNALRIMATEIRREKRLPLRLSIATAIPKGKRWQMLVEKCTELGVDCIIPMRSSRGGVKGEGDPGKWRRWAVEAAKQARRTWLPEITAPMPLSGVLEDPALRSSLLLLADPVGKNPQTYRETLKSVLDVLVIIGPEGGLDNNELELCRLSGAQFVCLSPFVLRIETAAVSACAIVREPLL